MEMNGVAKSDDSLPYSVAWTTTALNYLCLGNEPQSPISGQHVNSDTNANQACHAKSKSRRDDGSTESSAAIALHKLSRINGAVNKMTKEQLQDQLSVLNLSTSGVKDVLKKRLKHYHKCQKFALANRVLKPEEKMQFDYLVVIDYEATCSESNLNFVHEIIEFPAVLVDVHTYLVCGVFQRFCKPKINPRLTEFCTTLTGITQDTVDRAKDFTVVFDEFQEWLRIHGLGTTYPFAVLTDGPWDMARFLKTQTVISEIRFPPWAKNWINLRKAYSSFYGCGQVKLQRMLDDLGMTFEGRPHCGLDDARNIAAIAIRLLKDGCVLRVNEHYHEDGPGTNSRRSLNSSPPKSRLTHTSRPRQSHHEQHFIPQEGDNLDDLLLYSKLQKA